MDSQTSYASLMTNKDGLADSTVQIPHSQCRVPRSGDGSIGVGHFETSHGRRVAAKDMLAFACSHVPHAHVAIAATAHKGVAPGHHCPYSHHMTLQLFVLLSL